MSAASIPPTQSLSSAFDAAVAVAPAELAAAIRSRRHTDWALCRAWLWIHALATEGGARFVGLGPHPLLAFETDTGPLLMAPVLVRTPDHRAGDPDSVDRLVASLETVLMPRSFAVHLRKPLPADFDPSQVAGTAFTWSREGIADHVPYDDEELGVAFDLDLLPRDLPGDRGAWFVVPTSRGPEWLSILDHQITRVIEAVEDNSGAAIVPVLCADPVWGIGRGFQCQWLYGTPREVAVEPDAGALCTWQTTSTGFFGDARAARVPGVWWLEVADALPTRASLAARGWAHANPWATVHSRLSFPGATFREVPSDVSGPTLAWSSTVPTSWSVERCTRT